MMIRTNTSDEAENILQNILVDSIKIVIFLEFLINTYTFSLPVELVIVLVLGLIAMVDVVANLDEKYSPVAGLTKRVQTVVGFLILGIALSRAIADLQNLYSLDTVRGVTLAPLLSLILSPFLYVMVLLSKYKLLFLRIELGIEKEKGLKWYARRRILMHAGLSLRQVQHLLKNHASDLMRVQTKADVDRLLESVESQEVV